MPVQEVFELVGEELGAGSLRVTYRPYSELKHTWRRRGRTLDIRVSDYLDASPEDVLESLAWHILSRALRRRCPEGKADKYFSHARSEDLWRRKKEIYLRRARNLRPCASVEARDLAVAFDYVNAFYFKGRFDEPLLFWSTESPLTRVGFYFEPLDLMVVNKILDSPAVPRYVLEFVIYHELLHSDLGTLRNGARRVHHDGEFRRREREFLMYADAERWLRTIVRCAQKTHDGWELSPRCNSAVHGMREALSPP